MKKTISVLISLLLLAGMFFTGNLNVAAEEVKMPSDPDFDFENEYMYGDYNAHSLADEDHQGKIETFEEKEIVYEIINYDHLLEILNSEGNYLIQFSGSWCHNTRALAPAVQKLAKSYGIRKIYMYDFHFDNKADGNTFIRMTNGKENVGVNYNYMYGEIISQYLDNLDDWVEYPSSTEAAITYTNAEGKETTVARLQEPFLFLYNKDNKENNSSADVKRDKYPIVYAFEEMVDRDANGVYVSKKDASGEVIKDAEGKPEREYITEAFEGRLEKLFQFIKDNKIELASYDKVATLKSKFASLTDADKLALYPINYAQLVWLLDQPGKTYVLFANPSDDAINKMVGELNQKALDANVKIYLVDNRTDAGIVTKWNYKDRESTDFLADDGMLKFMKEDLIARFFTNLEAKDLTPGTLVAYQIDAVDTDGFPAPVVDVTSNAADLDRVLTSLK